jgi:spore maturation protein A
MVNYIWIGMLIIGVMFAMINGTMEAVNEALFVSAKEAVTLCLALMSILVFWLGLMKIAQDSGLLEKLSALFRPLVSKLFPDIPSNHPAMGYILANMMANFFGLGNAATPLGIKAMEQMKTLNGGKNTASRSMITFLALNTSSITLIPTTVIAIRITYDSSSPTEVVVPTIIATAISAVGAVFIDRYYYHKRKRNGRD